MQASGSVDDRYCGHCGRRIEVLGQSAYGCTTPGCHPRPPSSRKQPSNPEDRERFKTLVLTFDRSCVVHRGVGCEGPLEAHHVVTQQQLRRAGRHDLLWDPQNGALVCELAHRRHTLGVERIPLAALPIRCLRFAEREGFAAVVDRYYPAP